MNRLVVSGPAAVSSVVPQILADVTNRPVTCLSQPDMSAFGAATIARGLVEPDVGPARPGVRHRSHSANRFTGRGCWTRTETF